MPLDELITEVADQAYNDLTDDADFDIRNPDDKEVAKRKLEFWLMKLVIRAGSLG